MDVTHHCCQDLNVWIHAATVCIRILCSSARHRRCCCCCEEGWVKFPMSTKDVRTLLHELKHKLTSGWWWKIISKGYLSAVAVTSNRPTTSFKKKNVLNGRLSDVRYLLKTYVEIWPWSSLDSQITVQPRAKERLVELFVVLTIRR